MQFKKRRKIAAENRSTKLQSKETFAAVTQARWVALIK